MSHANLSKRNRQCLYILQAEVACGVALHMCFHIFSGVNSGSALRSFSSVFSLSSFIFIHFLKNMNTIAVCLRVFFIFPVKTINTIIGDRNATVSYMDNFSCLCCNEHKIYAEMFAEVLQANGTETEDLLNQCYFR